MADLKQNYVKGFRYGYNNGLGLLPYQYSELEQYYLNYAGYKSYIKHIFRELRRTALGLINSEVYKDNPEKLITDVLTGGKEKMLDDAERLKLKACEIGGWVEQEKFKDHFEIKAYNGKHDFDIESIYYNPVNYEFIIKGLLK